MMRFVMPIILIGISVTVFFLFTNPMYDDIGLQRVQMASYNEALNNSKALENQRDILTAKENSIDPKNLIKLQKLLPNNIDNIRLILEIGQIALPYGMVLKDVRYNATDTTKTTTSGAVSLVQGGGINQISNKDYGVWDLEFSTTGSYNNFLNFTKDLESNLRIVDISSITFSSDVGNQGVGPASSASYTYNFKIKTYWLKN